MTHEFVAHELPVSRTRRFEPPLTENAIRKTRTTPKTPRRKVTPLEGAMRVVRTAVTSLSRAVSGLKRPRD